MALKIYGASDDIIKVEGDIREEIECIDEEGCILCLSDCTVFKVWYDGVWRFHPLKMGLGNPAIESVNENTEVWTVDAAIDWVVKATRDDLYFRVVQ